MYQNLQKNCVQRKCQFYFDVYHSIILKKIKITVQCSISKLHTKLRNRQPLFKHSMIYIYSILKMTLVFFKSKHLMKPAGKVGKRT